MGARGPAPTSGKVLAMRGTARADRPREETAEIEIAVLTELPKPPGFLDSVGKLEWNRIGPELVKNTLLTVADLAAFTVYCVNVSRVAACEKQIQKFGMTYKGPNGAICQIPEVAISRQCGAEARRFAQEFGLTPSSRKRVRIPTNEKPAEHKPADGWGKVAAS